MNPQKSAHRAVAVTVSLHFGENTKKNPRPFTKAEKLDTQKGIRKRRNTPHGAKGAPFIAARVLRSRAHPIIPLKPSEVSQICGFASKYRTSTTTYQMA